MISTNSPIASFAPLAFVVLLGTVKEAIAEYKRWKEDKICNSTLTRKWTDFGWFDTVLADLKVGDIIQI